MGEQDTKTIILGTAGHIDHGKTTLVKALTGTDTDRLKEEKERGITIELGFARLDLPSGAAIGVVDVPGHERFVKNMVAGAMGVDLVALVIAADEGVMPQTSEHLEICQLLGVRKGLVVLTKVDMVDEEWLELVTEDIKEFMDGTFLQDAPVVPVSSVTGQGLDELLAVLDRMVAEIQPRKPSGPFRLPVDRSFIMKGFGTVVTGTVISGQAELGQDVMIYPKGLDAKIRGIQIHGREAKVTRPGLRTALNLQGVSRDQVPRGTVVASAGALHPSFLLDIEFDYLASNEKPLKHRAPIRFHAGTAEIIGRILLAGDEVTPGSRVLCQVKLEEPVALLPGDRYVIRSYSPIRTIGGGRVLNPVPRKRKRTRPEQWDELRLLASGSPEELILLHLKKAGIRGLTPRELSIRTGIYGKALKKELDRLLGSRQAVKFDADEKFVSSRVLEDLTKRAVEIMEAYHQENPLKRGMSREELKSRLFPTISEASEASMKAMASRLFQKVLDALKAKGSVVLEKELVRLSSHKVTLEEDARRVRQGLETLYKRAGLTPPAREEAVRKAAGSLDESEAMEIFDLLVRDGRLIRLKDNLFYHPEVIERLEQDVVSYLQKHQEMGVAEFRELTGGLSRKYMIPLLEHLDNRKVTIRIGDKRRLRAAPGSNSGTG